MNDGKPQKFFTVLFEGDMRERYQSRADHALRVADKVRKILETESRIILSISPR